MAWLSSVLLVVQVLCALAVIVLVLIQQGKGGHEGHASSGVESFKAVKRCIRYHRETGVNRE
ncbi:MAG: preprotein translocase subunit SecG [Betaproteobacteria bacterium]|nr:preprotein translocase subunit SecG [Betaproteobacteria bacterium]